MVASFRGHRESMMNIWKICKCLQMSRNLLKISQDRTILIKVHFNNKCTDIYMQYIHTHTYIFIYSFYKEYG